MIDYKDGYPVQNSNSRLAAREAIRVMIDGMAAESCKCMDDHLQHWKRIDSAETNQIFKWEERVKAIVETRRARHSIPLLMAGADARQDFVHSRSFTVTSGNEQIDAILQRMMQHPEGDIWDYKNRLESADRRITDGMFAVRTYIDSDGILIATWQDPIQLDPDGNFNQPGDSRHVWLHKRKYTTKKSDGTTEMVTAYYPDLSFHPSDALRDELNKWAIAQTKTPDSPGRPVNWTTQICTWEFNEGWPVGYAALQWARCVEDMLRAEKAKHEAVSKIPVLLSVQTDAIEELQEALEELNLNNDDIEANIAAITGTGSTLNIQATMLSPDNFEPFLRMIYMIFGLRPQNFGKDETGGLNPGSNKNESIVLSAQKEQSLWKMIYGKIIERQLLIGVERGLIDGYQVSQSFSLNETVMLWFGKSDRQIRNAISTGAMPQNVVAAVSKRLEPLKSKDSAESLYNIEYAPILAIDASAFTDSLIDLVTVGTNKPLLSTPENFLRLAYARSDLPINQSDVDAVKGLTWEQLLGAIPTASNGGTNE